MRKRKRMRMEREINENLLQTIYTLQSEWHKIQSFLKNSIEPSDQSVNERQLAQARYMFLLQEARYRNLSAIKYNRK